MPRRLVRRGSWQQARFTGCDMLLVAGWLAFSALVRSADYFLGEPTNAAFLVSFPEWVWGAMFGVPAVALLFGLLRRNHFNVWFGHTFLAIAYLLLVVVYLQDALMQPYWDGVKSATIFASTSLLHLLFALRTGPQPSKPGGPPVRVEAVVTPTPEVE